MSDTLFKAADDAMRLLVFTKFKTLMSITDMETDTAFVPKEIALRRVSEERGKTSVEFINVWRAGIGKALNRQSTFVARRGVPVTYTDVGETTVLIVKAQPCLFNYDIWFWSHSPEVLNTVDSEYIFWQQEDPNVDITLTIGDVEIPLELDMGFSDIFDESTVEMAYSKGVYYVHHVKVTLAMWAFDSTTSKAIQTIYFKCYDSDDLTDTDVLLFERTITGS